MRSLILASLVVLTTGCFSQEEEFALGRLENPCAGSIPICAFQAACVLGRWEQHRGNHELVLISDAGELTQRRALEPWTLKAGSPIQWKPVG